MTSESLTFALDVEASKGLGGAIFRPLAAGRYAPSMLVPAVVHVAGFDGFGLTLHLHETSAGVLRPVVVIVSSAAPDGVTHAQLRAFRMSDLAPGAALAAIVLGSAAPGDIRPHQSAVISDSGALSISDETVQAVAEVYRLAEYLAQHPTRYVREAFEMPRQVIDYWIKLARRRGYLPPAGKATIDGQHHEEA